MMCEEFGQEFVGSCDDNRTLLWQRVEEGGYKFYLQLQNPKFTKTFSVVIEFIYSANLCVYVVVYIFNLVKILVHLLKTLWCNGID